MLAANLLIIGLLLAAPLLALIIASLSGREGITLAYYFALFSTNAHSVFAIAPGRAIANSLFFALAATALAVALGLSASTALSAKTLRFRTFWEAVIMLPLATSAVTLGFGFIVSP